MKEHIVNANRPVIATAAICCLIIAILGFSALGCGSKDPEGSSNSNPTEITSTQSSSSLSPLPGAISDRMKNTESAIANDLAKYGDSVAVSVELLRRETWDGDPMATLTAFLNGLHD